METHSSILAWGIPWTEEPDRLQSMGSQASDTTEQLSQAQYIFVVIQLLSCVGLFVTLWTAAHQASLSFTISWSLLKLMSIELVMLSNHLILCCPLLLQSFSASGSFSMSWFLTSCGHSIGPSASASVLPVSIQGWFPVGLTGLISLPSKGLSRDFSSTTLQKHEFFSVQPSLWSNS